MLNSDMQNFVASLISPGFEGRLYNFGVFSDIVLFLISKMFQKV